MRFQSNTESPKKKSQDTHYDSPYVEEYLDFRR
nr:MAG TPA: hypothetical protein [Caudoviricetes sp.]